jgi:hypothetical protein
MSIYRNRLAERLVVGQLHLLQFRRQRMHLAHRLAAAARFPERRAEASDFIEYGHGKSPSNTPTRSSLLHEAADQCAPDVSGRFQRKSLLVSKLKH